MTDVFIKAKLRNGSELFTFVPFRWYGKGDHQVFQPTKPFFELLNRISESWKVDDPHIGKKMYGWKD